MGCIPSKCPSVLYDIVDTKDTSGLDTFSNKSQITVTGIPSNNIARSLSSGNPFLKPGINITGRIVLASEIWKIAIRDTNRVKYVCELVTTVCIWNELNKEILESAKSEMVISKDDMFIVNPFLLEYIPKTGRTTVAAAAWEVVMTSKFQFEGAMSILNEVCIWNEMNRVFEPKA